jgi:hypothetical protein
VAQWISIPSGRLHCRHLGSMQSVRSGILQDHYEPRSPLATKIVLPVSPHAEAVKSRQMRTPVQNQKVKTKTPSRCR